MTSLGHETGYQACPLPQDEATAFAVLPPPLAGILRKLLSKLHWKLRTFPTLEEAVAESQTGEATAFLCLDSMWKEAVAAMPVNEKNPVVVVMLTNPEHARWQEFLTHGALCMKANPVRMTELLPSLNLAWQARQPQRRRGRTLRTTV